MSVTVPLSPEAEQRLRERAEAAGIELTVFISNLITRAASLPVPIAKLSGPVAQHFHASGNSENDLIDELEDAKHAMRRDRKAGSGS